MRKIVGPRARWVFNFLAWVLLLLSLLIVTLAVLVPRVGGATPYTIATGSMKPGLPPGTLVVAKPIEPELLEVGDVITYQLESGKPEVVTHRIVAVGESLAGEVFYRTQGDANNVADEYLVRPVQVRGEMWYSLPYVGYLSTILVPEERGDLNTVLAIVLIAYASINVLSAAAGKLPKVNVPVNVPSFRWVSPVVPLTTALLVGAGFTVSVAGASVPSGAYWSGNQSIVGTSLTSGTVGPVTVSPYCEVWNTAKNRLEGSNSTCTVNLSVVGCTNSWSTAANVYLATTTSGVKLNPSNNWGNNLQLRFAIDLRALGCNPPGLNWNAKTAGISITGSYSTAPGYQCSQLPVFEGRTGYYNVGLNSYLGTLYFNRAGNQVSCA